LGSGLTAVVADEWELVGVGIEGVLTQLGVATTARLRDARPAIQTAKDNRVDLLVLGACRDLPSHEALRHAKRSGARARVALLLTGDHHADLGTLLAGGADALLQRSASSDELADGLKRLLDGQRAIAPALLPSLLGSADAPARAAATSAGATCRLTVREREVLERLAQGLTNKEIAGELFVGEETVKSHCARLYGKLAARDRRDAVAKALAAGLLG
jgi:DNA-binding NarL/FixJ family response regulator